MKIRRFYGKDMREALKQVKDELGDDAVIMSNKKLSDGVEIVAAYDKEPVHAPKRQQAPTTPEPKRRVDATPTLSEIIGDSGPDSLRALLEKQIQAKESAVQANSNVQASPIAPQRTTTQSEARQPQARSVNEPQQDALNEMRQELASLRNVLQFQVAGLIQQDKGRNHPLHGYLTSKLQSMGISQALANEVVSYTPADTDERQAWLFLLKLLANRIQTEESNLLTKGGVAVLMGPTGTGKTTTVAKLAAQAAQKYGAENVGLITLDSYRIAAYEQISTYARIIGCSVKKAQNAEELSDLLFQFRNKRLILIDTAGFGQRDVRLIKQLETLKQSTTANINSYLVMQANSQYQVMQQTIAAYKQISLQGCIFTKIDECYSLGEAISAAIEHKLPVSFITDGQKVPEDLKVADAKFLITSAAKLYKKHVLIHTSDNSLNNAAVAV
ncbi:flagellar biosynthesis protein FlhF [Paraglaciecola agarilytica]|uniref:flagellar biosynthesis protein FlhF n=1 Tax=Paraglaciecola chathamensis TaxID=368405 RepID=UPI001C0A213B|nr:MULTISPECIES: flagellar biosynthesis protein FlhF [Paraglaciecola]MBU3017255.1 flagellar biosynthesis protein FlhF [Paraglaciecola agarilytica]MDO6838212.1 flagellar biosynthesis protein FlhF [Paraglaciecola chathamensis]